MTAPDGSEECHILHVDMDAFYASVMLRDRPELRAEPVVIGGGHRGVILAANYPARRFGIRSGMSGADALRLCPQAVRLAPEYRLFEAVSSSVMETFRRVTPLVEAYSLDEAFLDVSDIGGDRRWAPRRDPRGQLPGAAFRNPVRDVWCGRAAALPAGSPAGTGVPALRGGLLLGDGDVPPGHAVGRGLLPGRGLPRRVRYRW